MKEAYIKQVKKGLSRSVSRKTRNEILRDLNEIFSSALEHGDTEAQVMERLGSPSDFVRNTLEQLGPAGIAPVRRRRAAVGAVSLAAAVAAFALLFAVRYRSVPANAIGYAEAMTGIRAEGPAMDLTPVVLAVGVTAAASAILQFARLIREGGKKQ